MCARVSKSCRKCCLCKEFTFGKSGLQIISPLQNETDKKVMCQIMDIRRPVFLILGPVNVAVICDKYVLGISNNYLAIISNKNVAVISNNYVAVIFDKYVEVISDKYVVVISDKYVAVISNGRRPMTGLGNEHVTCVAPIRGLKINSMRGG